MVGYTQLDKNRNTEVDNKEYKRLLLTRKEGTSVQRDLVKTDCKESKDKLESRF